jgi:hypothetical protein
MSTTNGAFEYTQVDPSDIKWTVEAGGWITILYAGGAYSYPTSKMIKRYVAAPHQALHWDKQRQETRMVS